MKNEFFLMIDTATNASVLVTDEEKGNAAEFRTMGQATSEGRRLINAEKASKFRVLKVVSDQT